MRNSKNCRCDPRGAFGQFCHNVTNQCYCREGFSGSQCNQCAIGFFDYPKCKKCNCDLRGSLSNKDGLIECDDLGQCPCKELVTGLKCNKCRQATFGLSIFNPTGCLRCLCFGRSQKCKESQMIWGQIRMHGTRKLSVDYPECHRIYSMCNEHFVVHDENANSYLHRKDDYIKIFNKLHIIPNERKNVDFLTISPTEFELSISTYNPFEVPLYFLLPSNFYGDQTKSYGGLLNFTINIQHPKDDSFSVKILSKYPLIQIHSHHKLTLDYFGVCICFFCDLNF